MSAEPKLKTTAHYNQSHTILLSLWMQGPIGAVSSPRAMADWILWWILSSEKLSEDVRT